MKLCPLQDASIFLCIPIRIFVVFPGSIDGDGLGTPQTGGFGPREGAREDRQTVAGPPIGLCGSWEIVVEGLHVNADIGGTVMWCDLLLENMIYLWMRSFVACGENRTKKCTPAN